MAADRSQGLAGGIDHCTGTHRGYLSGLRLEPRIRYGCEELFKTDSWFPSQVTCFQRQPK